MAKFRQIWSHQNVQWYLLKWAIPGFFFFFSHRLSYIANSKLTLFKNSDDWFWKPGSNDVGSDHSANCAKTTALFNDTSLTKQFSRFVIFFSLWSENVLKK